MEKGHGANILYLTMRISHLFISTLLFCTLLFAAKPAKQTKAPESGKVTVKGTIFPEETDKDGNPVSLYLSIVDKSLPEGGTDYLIQSDANLKEFLKLLYQTVEAAGTYTTNTSGRKVLKIDKFKLIENKPEDIEEEF
ncbi:MAG: hypothetical protein JNL74_12865 [Fibrobacteres bacterium]|nr:hypothetical protein [Fibrobacterota bacterium]